MSSCPSGPIHMGSNKRGFDEERSVAICSDGNCRRLYRWLDGRQHVQDVREPDRDKCHAQSRVHRHGVHDRDGEQEPSRDPRQPDRAVHQPAREHRARSRPAITTRTSTRASRTTCGWSPARTSACSMTPIRSSTRSTRRRTSPTSSSSRAVVEELPGEHGRAVRPDLARPLRRQAQPVRLLRRHQRLGWQDVPAVDSAATSTSSTTRSSTPTSRRNTVPEVRVHHAEPRRRHARRLDRPGRCSGCARARRRSWRPTRTRTAA